MKKILIVNFTRMGDLLQSTPLIAGLKRKYPESEITLAVMSNFRGICSGFPGIDRIISIDFGHVLQKLTHDGSTLDGSFNYLSKLTRRAGAGYDMVVNLSHSNLSAVYCYMTGCEDIRGQTMIPEGAIIVRHPWMNYFFNISKNRLYNSFNLVDMYNMTGDIDMLERKLYYEVPEDAQLFPNELLGKREGKFIGFQLGASTENKRWDPELFGELAKLIYSGLGWNIIVFGRGKEIDLFNRMREVYQGPLINAIDQTSLPQLAALLSKCELLISNDTGTMHLATAVGTGVIVLDLGEALAADTGPYTERALVLEANITCAPCSFQTECLDYKCHRYICPENVFTAIEYFDELTSGEITQLGETVEYTKLKISRPVFEPDGFWNLVPLIKRPLTIDDLLKGFYRQMWKKILNPEREGRHPDFLRYYRKSNDHDIKGKINDLSEKFSQLGEISESGIRVAEELQAIQNSPDVEKLTEITKRMIFVNNQIYHVELTEPELSTLATEFRLKKHNAEQGDLNYIAETSLNLYQTLRNQAKIMHDLLEDYLTGILREEEPVSA